MEVKQDLRPITNENYLHQTEEKSIRDFFRNATCDLDHFCPFSPSSSDVESSVLGTHVLASVSTLYAASI